MGILLIILIIVVFVAFVVLNTFLKNNPKLQPVNDPNRNKPKYQKSYDIALRSSNQYDFEIVGEASYQNNLASIAGPKASQSKELYLEAIIEAEPNNQYDKNAIRVSIDNKTVGYFDRETAKEFKRECQRKGFTDKTTFKANAVVVGGWKDKNSQGSYGVKLDIDSDNFGL